MKGIILAAGRGQRMKALTDEKPKCLVKLHGKPLLERQLDALRGGGISQIAIVTGYKHEMLEEWDLKTFHNPFWEKTNMVSSLCCADEWLEKDTCIVSYSDIFYDQSAVEQLINCEAPIAITYDPNWLDIWSKRFVDPLSDAETFRLNSDSTLQEIGETASTISEIQGQYMGLLRFTPQGWDKVKVIRSKQKNHVNDNLHMTGMLQNIIAENHIPVTALPFEGEWGEIDTIDDLAVFNT
jgi:L-glutamine-phosphate cytidylyltransferase